MWKTKGHKIVPFLNKFKTLAERDGYEYLLILVARPACDYDLFENLYRDWGSIDQLTGLGIMFLFVGPGTQIAQDITSASFFAQDSGEEKVHFSPHISVRGAKHRRYRQQVERLANNFQLATLAPQLSSPREFEELVRSHEAQISELRLRFGLREVELPSIVLIDLKRGQETAHSVRGIKSLYFLLQCLIDEIDNLHSIEERIRFIQSQKSFEARAAGHYSFLNKYCQKKDLCDQLPLRSLKKIIGDPLPWSPLIKFREMKTCYDAIKADPQCSQAYHDCRRSIQSLMEYLKQEKDTSLLNGIDITQLMLQSKEKSKNLLPAAIEVWSQLNYRVDKGDTIPDFKSIDVFISYSRKDTEFAKQLQRFLESKRLTVWRDDAIRAGFAFRKEIAKALSTASVAVVIWTKHSINSEWVEWEASTALRRACYLPTTDGSVDANHLPPPFGNYHMVPVNDEELLLRMINNHLQKDRAKI